MREMFSRESLQALFGRREDADIQHLLLPSELYHENTKNRRGVRAMLQRGAQDPVARAVIRRAETRLQRLYDLVQFAAKSYPNLPRVALPVVPGRLDRDLADAIRQRRSDRRLGRDPVSLSAVATMLELGYGVTCYVDPAASRLPRRAVPSGGALYPLEVYALAAAIEGLAPGVYHFEAFGRVLERLPSERLADQIRACFLDDDVAFAAITIVVTAVLQRLRIKYGDLAYRLALLEAGHVGQNVCLVATGLGLGVCPLAGYVDDALNDLLGVDGVEETVVYALAVGRRVGAAAGSAATTA